MTYPDWVNRTLGDRYRLEALVGQGGMAAVYRGFDPNLNRPVAVKLIHSHLSADPSFVRRFEAEAAAIAQLRHPNIIQVHDFSHDGATYYMVLEFLPGETLHARLAALTAAGARLPLAEAASIIATMAEAVHYAHERGLVHRDLKPANIMLEPDGRAVLMDFGIAKLLDTTGLTATGNVLGTARYMAPELALGQEPSPQSDLYALGITLFEMVAGEPPFDGTSFMSLMLKHVHQALPDLRALNPSTPPDLVAVVERALHKDPAQRYPTAAELAAALRALHTQHNVPRPALPSAAPPPAPSRDNEPTVVDRHALPPAPAASAVPGRPARASVPGPASPGAVTVAEQTPPPSPAAAPSPQRRPRSLAPLIALAAGAVALLVCLGLAASGGLLGLASLRGLLLQGATPAPTSLVAVSEPYTHPTGAFTFALPDGWLISEGPTGVSAYPPDQSALLRIDFTNAGVRLNQAGLEAFVTAVETNYFAGFPAYQRDSLESQPSGRLTVLKTLQVESGPPQTVFSQTWQAGLVVYEQHVWIPTAGYDRLAGGLLEVAATLTTDPAAAATALPYVAAYPFTTPNGQVEFAIPYAWTHRSYDNADGHVDEFASPDEATFIGSLTYEAAQPLSANDAAAFAAYLLEAYYADDMQLTGEADTGDGRVRLDWHSPARGFTGVSYYQTRDRLFTMLTWTVPADRVDLYLPVWDRALSTYRFP